MKIKEVSEKYGLSLDTLRFYEKKGLVGPISKNSSGVREYTEKDLQRLEFIKCMRSAGLSIKVLKRYVDLCDEGDDTYEERKRLLEEERRNLKEKLAQMHKAYEKLSDKIELYYAGKLDEYYKKTKNMEG